MWVSCCHKHLLGAEPFFLSNISRFFFFFLFLPQPLCVQFKLAVEWQASPLDLKLAGTSVSTTFPLRAASEIHNARGGGGRPPSFPKRTVEEQDPPPPVICIRLLWETGERWLWA